MTEKDQQRRRLTNRSLACRRDKCKGALIKQTRSEAYKRQIANQRLREKRRRNRPPINNVHVWKGEQETNTRYLYSMGFGPSDISYLLEIPTEAIKYVIYKKLKLYPPTVPRRKIKKPYMPKVWQ